MKIFDSITTKIKTHILHNNYQRPFDKIIKQHFNGKKIIGAEIGVLRGNHADCLLHHIEIKKLYLIDPYINYKGYEENYAEYGLENYFNKAKKRLSTYEDKVIFVKKKFQDAINDVTDLDFCYYDIHGVYEWVKKFIEMYYPKIREGGIIAGWNFDGNHIREPKAVLEFVEKNDLQEQFQGVGNDWWVIKPQSLSKKTDNDSLKHLKI